MCLGPRRRLTPDRIVEWAYCLFAVSLMVCVAAVVASLAAVAVYTLYSSTVR